LLSYPGSIQLANQFATLENIEDYAKEVASCKTFVFLHELEPLLKNNQVKGGNLDNALVIVDKRVSQGELDRLADLFHHSHVEVKENGYLSNTELTFSNEPARHKILDVIGDLSLIGCRLQGRVIATKPGHSVNTEMAKQIRKILKRNPDQVPYYDAALEPLMDINQIRQQYPQYNSMSDGELAFRLWDKDYKGRVPMGVFADRIKLPQQAFGDMTSFARSSGYQPTTESGTAQPVGSATGVPRSALQGMTFGFGDEIVGTMAGGMQAVGNVIRGQPANLGGEMQRRPRP
jgi:hypothetical protein